MREISTYFSPNAPKKTPYDYIVDYRENPRRLAARIKEARVKITSKPLKKIISCLLKIIPSFEKEILHTSDLRYLLLLRKLALPSSDVPAKLQRYRNFYIKHFYPLFVQTAIFELSTYTYTGFNQLKKYVDALSIFSKQARVKSIIDKREQQSKSNTQGF